RLAVTATRSEIRAPYTTRTRTPRPSPSAPNQNVRFGATGIPEADNPDCRYGAIGECPTTLVIGGAKISRSTMARIAAAGRIAARSRRSRSKASSHGPRLRMNLEVIATFLHRQEGNDKPSGGRANRRIVERAPAIHWRTV